MIPILIKRVLGVSLDELGISLINIRSTGFQNVAALFHDDRIRKKCSIVTDLDKSIIDTTPAAGDSTALLAFKAKCQGSQEAGIARKAALDIFTLGNQWVASFFAPNTFEVDFVTAGNSDKVIGVLGEVYKDPPTIATAKLDLESADIALYGKRVLTMAANEGKGWFAILLGKKIDHQTAIPRYILDAISFAHPQIATEVWFNVFSYRLHHIAKSGMFTPDVVAAFKTKLDNFRTGTIDFTGIRNEMLAAFAADRINAILEAF